MCRQRHLGAEYFLCRWCYMINLLRLESRTLHNQTLCSAHLSSVNTLIIISSGNCRPAQHIFQYLCKSNFCKEGRWTSWSTVGLGEAICCKATPPCEELHACALMWPVGPELFFSVFLVHFHNHDLIKLISIRLMWEMYKALSLISPLQFVFRRMKSISTGLHTILYTLKCQFRIHVISDSMTFSHTYI